MPFELTLAILILMFAGGFTLVLFSYIFQTGPGFQPTHFFGYDRLTANGQRTWQIGFGLVAAAVVILLTPGD